MDATHVIGLGPSGGGKSTMLREHHETFDGVSVVVNHSGMDKVAGHRAVGPKAMATGIEKFADWSNVRINLLCDDPVKGAELAIRFAIDVWDTAGVPTQICMDEFQHSFHDDAPDEVHEHPVLWALTEGRDKGIKFTGYTQNPKNVPYTKMESVKWFVWVGGWSMPMKGFMNYYGLDGDDLPDENYVINVFDRQSKLVYEGETQEKYA